MSELEPIPGPRFKVLGQMKTVATVPWAFMAPHERQAQSNHSQSLKRLDERGGLGWSEMWAVITDRQWERVDEEKAEKAVRARLAIWEAGYRAALAAITTGGG